MTEPDRLPESLSEHLSHERGIETEEGIIRVLNRDGANWCLRILAKIEAERKENEQLAQLERERIDEWERDMKARSDQEASRFTQALEAFHRAELARDDHAKTIRLPAGTLKARKLPDKLTVDDELFVPWATITHPELLRVIPERREPDKPAIKKLIDDKPVDPDSGELIPGVEIETGEVRFSQDVGQ